MAEKSYLQKLEERVIKNQRLTEREKNYKEKQEETKTVDKYSIYREACESRATLEVIFDGGDPDGNLSCYDDNGVRLMLLADTFRKGAPYYSSAIMNGFIGNPVTLRVEKVDEKTNTVYLESGISRFSKSRRLNTEIKLIMDQNKKLRAENDAITRENKGKPESERKPYHKVLPLYVYGRVVSVGNDTMIVDIYDQGVKGLVKKHDWSNENVIELRSRVNVGDMLQFEVVKSLPKTGSCDWQLSRKNIAPDPWDNFPDDITAGMTILVKCISRPEGKSYWFGSTSRVPEIRVFGDYTRKTQVMVGEMYECNVVEADKKKKSFKVAPFRHVATTGGTPSVRVLKQKVKKAQVGDKTP